MPLEVLSSVEETVFLSSVIICLTGLSGALQDVEPASFPAWGLPAEQLVVRESLEIG